MIGFLLGAWRRWRVRRDLYDNKPERHPALVAVREGELIPFKGTHWRVASVRELPIPALILVPVQETRASKIAHLRKMRRADRILSRQEVSARRALAKRAS